MVTSFRGFVEDLHLEKLVRFPQVQLNSVLIILLHQVRIACSFSSSSLLLCPSSIPWWAYGVSANHWRHEFHDLDWDVLASAARDCTRQSDSEDSYIL